jgi:hypothetical protein
MGLVVFGEKDLAAIIQFLAQIRFHPNLILDPDRYGLEKRDQAGGGTGQIGMEQTIEFEKGLFIERQQVHGLDGDSPFLQTIGNGVPWQRGVVLLAREALFLGGGHDNAVAH